MKQSFYDGGIYTVLQAFENDLAYLSVREVEFGIEFQQALEAYPVTDLQKIEIKERGFKYFKQLCIELAKRVPQGLNQFQGLNKLLPSVCLNQMQSKFEDLPFLKEFAEKEKLGAMEVQWAKLPLIDWKTVCMGTIPKRSHEFWPAVFTYEDAGGTPVFSDLALYVLRVLSLPTSNAVVERVFSIMNSVKTKARNRMLMSLLDAILRIRIRFAVNIKYIIKTSNRQNLCSKNLRIKSSTRGNKKATTASLVKRSRKKLKIKLLLS